MKSLPKSIQIAVLVTTFCYLLTSPACTTSANEISHLPSFTIPDEFLNKDLVVSAPSAWNNFNREENSIILKVVLATEKQIAFAPDFNAEIYIYDNTKNEWEEIDNLGVYESPPGEIILGSGETKIVVLMPDFSGTLPSQNVVMVLLSGYVFNDNHKTDTVIGSYIIIKLEH